MASGFEKQQKPIVFLNTTKHKEARKTTKEEKATNYKIAERQF